MTRNDETNQIEKIYEKSPVATGFTPEHELGESFILNEKKKHQQAIMKSLL